MLCGLALGGVGDVVTTAYQLPRLSVWWCAVYQVQSRIRMRMQVASDSDCARCSYPRSESPRFDFRLSRPLLACRFSYGARASEGIVGRVTWTQHFRTSRGLLMILMVASAVLCPVPYT